MKDYCKSFLWVILLICVFAIISGCCCCAGTQSSPATATPPPTVIVNKDINQNPAAGVTQTTTATSTPSPTQQGPKIGTKANPVPLGTTIMYTPTAWASSLYGSTAKITLLEVIKGEQANQLLKQANMFNEPRNPSTDDLFLAKFRVEIEKANSDKTYRINEYNFKASNDAGTKLYDMSFAVYDPKLNAELLNGGSADGWVVLECGKTDNSPMIVFDQDYDGSGGIWFKTSS